MRTKPTPAPTIRVPEDWHIERDPSPEIALVALAPPDRTGFSRNIVLTIGPMTQEWRDAGRWQRTAAEAILSALGDAQLIDASVEEDGFRQLISYVAEGRALTLEQWATIHSAGSDAEGGNQNLTAVTVSATTPTLAYPDHAEEMCDIAWSLDVGTGPEERS